MAESGVQAVCVEAQKHGCIDDLISLQKHKGSIAVFSILPQETICIGNLDDREYTDTYNSPVEKVSYHIHNIYTRLAQYYFSFDDPRGEPRFVLVTNQDNLRLLIPFQYKIIPHITLRRRCETLERTLVGMEFADNSLISTTDYHRLSPVDDGCLSAHHDYDKYTQADADKWVTGHRLALVRCEYDKSLNAIKGEIDLLLAGCKPLW